jgi:hypothetical protein
MPSGPFIVEFTYFIFDFLNSLRYFPVGFLYRQECEIKKKDIASVENGGEDIVDCHVIEGVDEKC